MPMGGNPEGYSEEKTDDGVFEEIKGKPIEVKKEVLDKGEQMRQRRDKLISEKDPKTQERLMREVHRREQFKKYVADLAIAMERLEDGEVGLGVFEDVGLLGGLLKKGPNGERIRLTEDSKTLNGIEDAGSVFLEKSEQIYPVGDSNGLQDVKKKYFFEIFEDRTTKTKYARLIPPYADQDPREQYESILDRISGEKFTRYNLEAIRRKENGTDLK